MWLLHSKVEADECDLAGAGFKRNNYKVMHINIFVIFHQNLICYGKYSFFWMTSSKVRKILFQLEICHITEVKGVAYTANEMFHSPGCVCAPRGSVCEMKPIEPSVPSLQVSSSPSMPLGTVGSLE